METCCGYWYGQARKWSCVARFSRMRRLSIALCVASIFKGRRKRTGRLKVRGALPAVQPRLRPTRFRGRPKAPHDAFRLCVMAVKKKRELFPGHSPTSRGWFVLPRARRVVKSSLFPRPGPGILTWFPFDRVRFWMAHEASSDSHRLEEQKLPHVSGPTDPCPNAVHMEPFSTSVFKDLI